MTLPVFVAQLQQDHVVLELECIDRLYLNAYVPKLTSAAGVARFLRGYLGHRFASTKYAGEMTDRFVTAIRDFLQREDIELVRFQKGQRKDEEFYGDANNPNYSQHYAQARCLCYYLQEKWLLAKFYREFVANVKSDPTGYNSLKRVLGEEDMVALQKKWEKFTLDLRKSEDW